MAEAVRHDKTARQLRLLSDALDSGRLGPVRRLVNTLSPAEIGNLLESLPPAKRTVVWGLVGVWAAEHLAKPQVGQAALAAAGVMLLVSLAAGRPGRQA